MATILVIDDKPANRDLLRTVLGINHRVLEASDGQEGLEMVCAERPDLVIADILMPRMDGYEMVHRLRADPLLADTRVIFYTATYLRSEALKLAQARGVSHLIIKPADPQDILDTVNTVLSEDPVGKCLASNEAFNREHLRLMTDKLAEKLRELEDSNHRLIEEAAQRRYAEDALRSSEARMRAILDSAIESIITMDFRSNVVELNPAAEAMFGYSRKATIGKPFPAFILRDSSGGEQPEDLVQYATANRRAVLGKPIGLQLLTGRGVVLPVELTVTLILTQGYPLFTAYIRDLTQQKAHEEMHRRSEDLEKENRHIQEVSRLKTQFLANMSHELRTPLNAIIGFSELMYDGKVGPVSSLHKEYFEDILGSSRHLLDLINDILDLTKVEAGKMEFHAEPVDLEDIVRDVSVALQPLAAGGNLDLETDLDRSLIGVVTDPRSLKQVLYNYVSNAIKFTGENGRVVIRSRFQPPDCFRIEVEDNGIGIRAKDSEKLFTEFHQIQNSQHKKYPGTGLGLALTKRLVEAQGGQVGVRSTLGRGSLFYAVLPLGNAESAEIREATEDGERDIRTTDG